MPFVIVREAIRPGAGNSAYYYLCFGIAEALVKYGLTLDQVQVLKHTSEPERAGSKPEAQAVIIWGEDLMRHSLRAYEVDEVNRLIPILRELGQDGSPLQYSLAIGESVSRLQAEDARYQPPASPSE